jgi:hypothetical protein
LPSTQQSQALQEVAAKLAQAEQAAAALLQELSGPGAAAALAGLSLGFPTSLLQQLLLAAQGEGDKQQQQQQQEGQPPGNFLADAAAEELRDRLKGLATQVVELQVQLAYKDAQFQKLLQVRGVATQQASLRTGS